MREIVRVLLDTLESGREAILCQVVETRGSTPQKAGALLIVDPSGGQTGTLGGGCVENEVKQKAIRQLGTRGACLHSFVLDHDQAWADGLICGGKMVVLTEALQGDEPLAYFRQLYRLIEAGDGFTEAIVVDRKRADATIDAPEGGRFLFGPDASLRAAWPECLASVAVSERIRPIAERPKTAVQGGISVLPSLPRVRLIIVGAGHVGQAVASLASQVDFDVWVIDDRAQFANSARFPKAQKILVGPIEDLLVSLEVTPHTYALIVTRGHGHDQEALFHLATTIAPYVGLIGSRRKIKLIFENLREQGIREEDLARVTAPVGLDIGSQTVTEIAVSIVAELISRRNLGSNSPTPRQPVAIPT